MNQIDNLFSGMDIAASGAAAERRRMDVIAENIANARVTRTPEGVPYRRKMVEFAPLVRTQPDGTVVRGGVRATAVVEDHVSPMERIHEPSHPDADATGWVEFPNVNTTTEMADLITALRAYEANLMMQESFVEMAQRALQLLR